MENKIKEFVIHWGQEGYYDDALDKAVRELINECIKKKYTIGISDIPSICVGCHASGSEYCAQSCELDKQ